MLIQTLLQLFLGTFLKDAPEKEQEECTQHVQSRQSRLPQRESLHTPERGRYEEGC